MSEGGSLEESLAPQLGTDPVDMELGRIDVRRLTIISRDKLPALMYGSIRARTSPTWKLIMNSFLNYQISIGGRGRRDIIRMEQVSKGGSADVQAEIEAAKPESWVQRNFTKRNWREEEKERLGEV